MKNLLFTFFLIISMSISTDIFAQENSIIYIGDPMCSWCYGFGPEVSKVKEAYPDTDFRMVMGGLRPYGTETMASLKDFLHEHWEEIGKRTGQEFNFGILDQSDFIYDTEPASRAVVVMRDLNPEKALDFFKGVQQLFYKENLDTRKLANYKSLVTSFGVDFAVFSNKFSSEEYKTKTREDFTFSQQLGVRGFPSMILKMGEDYFLLSNGFAQAEKIISSLKTKL